MKIVNTKNVVQNKLDEYQKIINSIPVLMGDANGIVSVVGQPGYVYVRDIAGNTLTVWNSIAPLVPNLAVMIGNVNGRLQVVQVRDIYYNFLMASVAPHGYTHSFTATGTDISYIYAEQFIPWYAFTSDDDDFTVTIIRQVMAASTWVASGTEDIDLNAYIPVDGTDALFILITLDVDGALQVTAGTPVANKGTLVVGDIPEIPYGNTPLWAVILYVGQTAITRTVVDSDYIDLRFSSGGSGGGGGASSSLFDTDTVSADTTLDQTYTVVNVDATGANKIITVPAAASYDGKLFIINKIDAGAFYVRVNVTETIEGNAYHILKYQYESISLISNGTNWYIVNRPIVVEGQYLQIGSGQVAPTTAEIHFGDSDYCKIYEKYDDCLAVGVGGTDGLIVGWGVAYGNFITMLGDIDGADHGNYLNIDEDSFTLFNQLVALLTVLTGGNVGIGDDNPATLLVLSASNDGQTENNTLRFADTDLAAGSPQQIGKIEFYSNDSSPDGAGITSYIQGLHVTSGEGALIFATGTIASLAEHMRIDHEGLTTITGSVKTTVPLGYAEMYMYDNVTECVIDTANIYHAIYNTFGNNDGTLAPLIDTTHFTYKAGVGEIVASIVTYDAGNKIQCTVTAGHSFLAGEPVTLSGFATGAGTYNGVYLIEAAGLTATEFVVAVAYTGDEAGSVRKPATMECLVAGNYNAGFNFSGTAGNPNDNIKIELNRDLTPLDNIVARGIWSSSSKYESLSARGLVALTVGQYVWASVKNYSGSGNFTFYSGNVDLCRLI